MRCAPLTTSAISVLPGAAGTTVTVGVRGTEDVVCKVAVNVPFIDTELTANDACPHVSTLSHFASCITPFTQRVVPLEALSW